MKKTFLMITVIALVFTGCSDDEISYNDLILGYG